MQTLWLVLLPIIFFINSYCIGKIYNIWYKTLSTPYSIIAGWFSFISIICFLSIPFYFFIEIQQYYLYVLLAIQIILLIVYFFNYKNMLIGFIFEKNKIIVFLLIFLIVMISFIFFIFFPNIVDSFILKDDKIIKNSSLMNFFINSIFNYFNVNKIYFNKYSLPIFVAIMLIFLVFSFAKFGHHFSIKKYISISLLTLFLSILIFSNESNHYNNYSLLYLGLFFSLHFLITKYNDLNFKNNYLIYNCFTIYIVTLNSNNFIYLLLIHALFVMSNYSMKNNFGLDNVLRATIYLLIPSSLSILTLPIYVPLTVFVVFILFISIYYIFRKNDNYYTYIYNIETFLNNRMKYIVIFVFGVVFTTLIILFFKNQYIIDIDVFLFKFRSSNNLIFQNITKICYFIFYAIIIVFSYVYFVFRFNSINKAYIPSYLICLAVVLIYNPLFITLLSYVNLVYEIDYYIIFLTLFLIVYLFFFRNTLKMNHNDQHQILVYDNKQFLDKIKIKTKCYLNNILFSTYCLISTFIIIIPVVFRLI